MKKIHLDLEVDIFPRNWMYYLYAPKLYKAGILNDAHRRRMVWKKCRIRWFTCLSRRKRNLLIGSALTSFMPDGKISMRLMMEKNTNINGFPFLYENKLGVLLVNIKLQSTNNRVK